VRFPLAGRQKNICLILTIFFVTGFAQPAQAAQFQAPAYEAGADKPITGVDLYIDATASLRGFVRSDRLTTFAYFTRIMEGRLHSLFPPSTQLGYQLNRFGLKIDPFGDMKDAWRPAFYDPVKGYEDTDLSVVARQIQRGHLTVIITDLFQSDSHIEAFRTELVKRGLGRAFQCAVMAFRADFDGKIYDIPPSKSTLRYKGQRPAYALVFAPAGQLRIFLDEMLSQKSELGTDLYCALLTNEIGTPAKPFTDLVVEKNRQQDASSRNSFYMEGFDPDEGLIAGGPRSFARQLRLGRSAQQPFFEFQSTIMLRDYEPVPSIDSIRLVHTTRMCDTDSPGIWEMLTGKTKDTSHRDPCPIAEPAFDIIYADSSQLQARRLDQDRIALDFKPDFGKRGSSNEVRARPSKVYVLQLKAVSSQRNAKLPEWVSRFNEDERQTFDGSKTPDLRDFMASIQDSVSTVAPTTVFSSYVYINSK
jgi:hypothetical protein